MTLPCQSVSHSLNAHCEKLLGLLVVVTFVTCYIIIPMLIVFTCNSLSCYMDLPKFVKFIKLLHGFFKAVLCISRPLPNKTKQKFDQDLKAC